MDLQVHLRTRSTSTHHKDGHGGLTRQLIGAARSEAKRLCQEASRRFEFAQREPHRVEAVNCHLNWHWTSAPGGALQLSGIIYKFETLPFRITERKHEASFFAACLDAIVGNVEIIEALRPPGESVLPGNTQRDCRNAANSRAVRARIRPIKEGQVRAWTTQLISIEKVIGR